MFIMHFRSVLVVVCVCLGGGGGDVEATNTFNLTNLQTWLMSKDVP